MWDKHFYAPSGAALDIALRVWYFRFRRLRNAIQQFGITRVALPPVYGVMGTELAALNGYWVLRTPWFKVRWEYAKS